MHFRSFGLLTLIVLVGCERSRQTPGVAQTGRSAAVPAIGPTDSTRAAAPSEPPKVRDWESWIPEWQIALRHPDTIPLVLGAPRERCTRQGEWPLDTLSETESHPQSVRLQPTNL